MRYNLKEMKLLTRCVVMIASLITAAYASAQSVTNVDANQEGKAIAITYDLKEKSNITLFVTQDGGKTKTLVPKQFTSGDVGSNVTPGLDKKILWHVLDQYPNENFLGNNLSFIVTGKPSMRIFAMLNAGYSLNSGFTIGVSVGQIGFIGWYVKALSTLTAPKATTFECDGRGYVDGTLPAYSGSANSFMIFGVVGANVRLGGSPVYFNAGLGYGMRNYAWETVEGKWVKNRPGSYSGIAVDAGLMTKLGNVILSAGVSLVIGHPNWNVDINAGVGYVF